MPKEIYARTAQKHDTEANWNKAVNFIPANGEMIIYDPDTQHPYKRFKIGDGVTVAMNLPFTNSQVQMITWESDD